jgi:hypothetical protein
MRPVILVAALGVASAMASAQSARPARAGIDPLNCRACPTAATPTKKDPALVACPRLKLKGFHLLDEAPVALTLGTPDGRYGLVQFAHRAHAHMAETAKGCSGCHHYDQAGPIQPCRTCHATSRKRSDLGKPDLKGAMHRQCLECHRDWNAETSCSTCHAPAVTAATAKGAASDAARRPAKTSKVVAPTRIVYETAAKEGKTVTFFHADHTDRFALACASCHVNETCRTCHSGKPAGAATATLLTRKTASGTTQARAHEKCAGCHAKDACATCHTSKEPRTASFDHALRTGWPLNRFHAPLACKQCHTTPAPYTALKSDCESCHAGWQKKFEHARTGLALDDVHAGVECASCHEDKTFRAKPVCGSCHTDKAWPAQKPGKVVGRAGPRG